LGPGGKGSNQSVAAARLGAKVYFISKVGEDNFGDMAQKTYDAEGIDTRFLIRTQGGSTGAARGSSCRSQAARTPLSSVITLNPAIRDRVKSGHREWPKT
jgi:bifunctional ADP-heptose synthase (sugar kinase/adenylyltransferase)